MHYDQAEYDLRCEWGLAGVPSLAPHGDVLIVVDVLVFSTAVDIAVARGASVLPYCWRDSSAGGFAQSKGALLASPRPGGGYSLLPPSLQSIPAGAAATFTACLRNCSAVAAHARARGSRIAVVPAGEQWGDGALRPAIEDLIGVGAVLANLPGRPSPEAERAIAAFERFRHSLHDTLARSTSGKELVERGFACDVRGSRRISGEPGRVCGRLKAGCGQDWPPHTISMTG